VTCDAFQNLSAFSSVVKDLRTPNTIVLIPGDLLGVSVTSILDKGVTVIELLNRIGVDIVTLGNSEANVPSELLAQRMSDFKGKCLNSNLPHLPHQLPEYEIVQVRGPGGSMRKVGLVGICTHSDPAGTSGEAWKTSLPAVEAVTRLRKKLVEELGCDVVVPITNQMMAVDVALAREIEDLPLIIGAHDHEPAVRMITADDGSRSTTIVKAGLLHNLCAVTGDDVTGTTSVPLQVVM
jgi:2',3'-cyclic-nucleotide 2'-phosphodiesterase (5'-nucleotidase family)